MTVTFL
jgi:MFS family permease